MCWWIAHLKQIFWLSPDKCGLCSRLNNFVQRRHLEWPWERLGKWQGCKRVWIASTKSKTQAKWLFFCFSHCITLRYLCFPPEKQINFRETNRLVLTEVTQKSLLVRANIICLISKFMSVLKFNLRSKFSWRWPYFFSQVRKGANSISEI